MENKLNLNISIRYKMKKRILLITYPSFRKVWKDQLINNFKKASFVFVKDEKNLILNNVSNCHAMIGCPRYVFKEEDFNNFKYLEWIHAGGAGVEDFMTSNLKLSDITFTNGKIIQGPEVADHAVALLLYFTRNFNELSNKGSLLSRPIELMNKKILIVGLGGIGFNIYERLKSFGSVIDALTNDMPPISYCLNKVFYNQSDLVLSNYDAIISAAPLTNRSKSMFNYKFFKRMKKGSIFINVSRGKLVKSEDLLKDDIFKKFRGLGLDVTDPEPLAKSHKLNKANNVFITPHIAGLSDQNRERGFNLIKLNLHRYLNNLELLNVVNKQREY